MNEATRIYIGTILLEKHRWGEDRTPSYRVSEWAGRFARAGFDGMELWANHALGADEDELARLENASPPVTIFNSYATCDDAGRDDRLKAAEIARRLGAGRVKFNVGKDPAAGDEYLGNVIDWQGRLGQGARLLCECHPGTIIEQPAAAKEFFDRTGAGGWEIIVHPFSRLEGLAEWFERFGPAVTHAHLQMRTEDRTMVRFDRRPNRAAEAVRIMRDCGFAGSWTLEFTGGTGAADENIQDLYAGALTDLAFLKELLA